MSTTPLPPPPPPLPPNWPSHLPYFTHPLHSPTLTPSHLSFLRKRPSQAELTTGDLATIPASHPLGPSPSVLIQRITNPAHPAWNQHGLFAARDLAPGELVVRYIGVVHAGIYSAEHEESDYDLWVDREGDVAVDAAGGGNEGRFVNDYRGVPVAAGMGLGFGKGGGRGTFMEGGKGKGKKVAKRRPNAEFRAVWDEGLRERGMGVFVLPAGKKAVGRERDVGISAGEEILVSYGKGFWGKRRGEADGEDVTVQNERGSEECGDQVVHSQLAKD